MNPEYYQEETESKSKILFCRIKASDQIRKRLEAIGAEFTPPTTRNSPEQLAEYSSQAVKIGALNLELRTYPFLGLFVGVQQEDAVPPISNLLDISTESFSQYAIERTRKTAEQWMHRGLELTFKQVEVLSDPNKTQKHNRERYGVDSPFMFTSVDLEVNSACNRKCPYCPNFAFERKHQGCMNWDLFQKVVGELAEIDYDHYVHYHFNNEPLLHPNLEALVSEIKSAAPHARHRIFTNGDFLTLDKFRSLVTAGADYFIVTLHGSKDGKMYKHIEHLLANISEEERIKIDIQFPQNLRFNNRSGLVSFGPQVDEITKHLPCFRPSFKIVVLVNGFVLPCDNDFMEQEIMGDIKTDSLRAIWTGEKFTKFREEISSGNRPFSQLCVDCNKEDHGAVLLFDQTADRAEIGSYPYK